MRTWLSIVLRAPVPETPVDKYSDLDPREYQVSGASYFTERLFGDPVSQTKRMGSPANSELRFGIPRPVALHYLPCGRTRCPARILHLLTICPHGSARSD
ncbi:hypothetical protein NicSoilC12_24350 [Arthrobacter sp. NicSoilC12]|nr:hypothetical protein NicSoilC12_24350 [Arthrobacter sp. NicSoilC12]